MRGSRIRNWPIHEGTGSKGECEGETGQRKRQRERELEIDRVGERGKGKEREVYRNMDGGLSDKAVMLDRSKCSR